MTEKDDKLGEYGRCGRIYQPSSGQISDVVAGVVVGLDKHAVSSAGVVLAGLPHHKLMCVRMCDRLPSRFQRVRG